MSRNPTRNGFIRLQQEDQPEAGAGSDAQAFLDGPWEEALLATIDEGAELERAMVYKLFFAAAHHAPDAVLDLLAVAHEAIKAGRRPRKRTPEEKAAEAAKTAAFLGRQTGK